MFLWALRATMAMAISDICCKKIGTSEIKATINTQNKIRNSLKVKCWNEKSLFIVNVGYIYFKVLLKSTFCSLK